MPKYAKLLRVPAVLVVAALLLPALAACGDTETLPPEQVIERAVPAIQGANSFHFLLETSKTQQAMPGLFITRAEGDVARPDKLAGDLSATYSGLPIAVKVVVDGESQYLTDPASGRWTTMDKSFDVVQFFDPSKGVSDILSGVKGLSSDGKESIDGTDTYRLKGRVPAAALKSLSTEVTATGELTTTLWVGSGDFLLRRVKLVGPLLAGEPADLERTISMSNYNEEVTIETPVVP